MTITPKVEDRSDLIKLLIEFFDVFAEDGSRLTFTELNIILFMLLEDTPDADYRNTKDRIPIMNSLRFSDTGMTTHLSNIKAKGWLQDGKLVPAIEKLRSARFPFELNLIISERPSKKRT